MIIHTIIKISKSNWGIESKIKFPSALSQQEDNHLLSEKYTFHFSSYSGAATAEYSHGSVSTTDWNPRPSAVEVLEAVLLRGEIWACL